MTEAEWLGARHPYELIYHKSCRNDRKRRLLACACTRRILSFLPGDIWERVVEVSERYAEAQATDADLRAARKEVAKFRKSPLSEYQHHAARAVSAVTEKAFMSFKMSIESAASAWASKNRAKWENAHDRATREQLVLTLDIFANPFRPVKIDDSLITWHDRTIPKLAHAAYEERELPSGHLDNNRLAILSDALGEAGAGKELLEHLRQPEVIHVRGCWVIDLLLGMK
jgi:hypothetical protein